MALPAGAADDPPSESWGDVTSDLGRFDEEGARAAHGIDQWGFLNDESRPTGTQKDRRGQIFF